MCGICGIFNLSSSQPVSSDILRTMISLLHHRGPDEAGLYRDACAGLGHTRLSIIDLSGGSQPIHNEDRTIWIVYNGEVFNYPELREELIKKGHRFATSSDTEVLVHLYEEKGTDMFARLNGQFAFALWDIPRRRLLLARDRTGVRPLFYTQAGGRLLFGSEVKALFADPSVPRALDPRGLDQLFTFWTSLPPRTVFKDISELPPAHYLLAENGSLNIKRYWDISYTGPLPLSEKAVMEQLNELLLDAIRVRLRADVPVGAYLSGGLDSSLITALVKRNFNNELKTFSIGFADHDYDESAFQKQMASHLGTDHHEVTCTPADIGAVMPETVWHAEKPLIRTAPGPMYLLSRLVRENRFKVVLTGEGADEIFGGYDLFKEMKIRRFWARQPGSRVRPNLLSRLYQYIPDWPRQAPAFLVGFYRARLGETDKPYYSHIPRWEMTSGIKNLYSAGFREQLEGYDPLGDLLKLLPDDLMRWDELARAQYIEMQTLLSGNLLSSQGDRMAMANAVEGRYPFLDHRVMEFAFNLPANLKIKGLNEKYILKKTAAPFLPESITKRVKQAYRSPDCASFFNGFSHPYLEEILDERNITSTGYFTPQAVNLLAAKSKAGGPAAAGARHNIAVTGILTTLLLDRLFVKGFDTRIPNHHVPIKEIHAA